MISARLGGWDGAGVNGAATLPSILPALYLAVLCILNRSEGVLSIVGVDLRMAG
jgi:hypothetical protein